MFVDTVTKPGRSADPVRKPRRHLVDQLLMIAKAARALTSLHLVELDLEVGQDQFLNAAGSKEIVSITEISRLLNVKPSTVSKMADRLVAKGLIERSTDAKDARRTLVGLTDEGTKRRAEVHATWDRIEANLAKAEASLKGGAIAETLNIVDRVLRTQLHRLR